MVAKVESIRHSINKAYLKEKLNRSDIDKFKEYISILLLRTDASESEEHLKNLIADFLKNTYYSTNYYINTKGRNDLVIYTGKDKQSKVGVIIEAKSLKNNNEMPSEKNLNTKALQELLLYYLRERIQENNLEIKHLIITNLEQWYIFDGQLFEKLFASDRELIKQFEDFKEGRLGGRDTEFFYKKVAKPVIETNLNRFHYTYFNIADYKNAISNNSKKDDNRLIPLYKIFSPEHLLKLPFANDSNRLDKGFYTELLHIIGLKEQKDGSKAVIQRKPEKERNSGSLIECAIHKIDGMDMLYGIENLSQYGSDKEEQLFNVALELSITWINRILFLKLLEGQLIAYNHGDESYAFLNSKKIKSFDDLNDLFFLVMAKQMNQRDEKIKYKFTNIPYLNSSLFDRTALEARTINISAIADDVCLTTISDTVLKDHKGKTSKGSIPTLEYLFSFLDAYDFTSDGAEEIQEENKSLINASVLGLIFEKINGYKDGSFFTPGYITMYISHETISRTVLQKFKEIKNWDCQNLDELREKIGDTDKKEANDIINSIKICDPAVGSGHFLVSALNEMIAIKAELRILVDNNGIRLRDYNIEVQNDELTVTDEYGKLFEYRHKIKESQIVQETLFREKRTIIENCLFGVDINPNSVKICQLRLWIELLKNAYYKDGAEGKELETLPNIDINIKCGNSLISRFPLKENLTKLLKASKWSIETYQSAVSKYHNAHTKEEKHDLVKLIDSIKNDFKKEVLLNDPLNKKLRSFKTQLSSLTQANELFGEEERNTTDGQKKIAKLKKDIQKIELKKEDINRNKIFVQAFEWRFEFPEVLDKDGTFLGFDCIIGNPPYIQLQKMKDESDKLAEMNFVTYTKTGDIYMLFYELGERILRKNGYLTFITSNKWMRAAYGESLRQFLKDNVNTKILIDFAGQKIFDSATVDTNILHFSKSKYEGKTETCQIKDNVLNNLSVFVRQQAIICHFNNADSWAILSNIEQRIKEKIERNGTPLKDWDIQINYGIKTGFNDAFIIDGAKRKELIELDTKSEEIIRPILRGRDIKRYGYEFADIWLLFIPWHFPLHEDASIKGASEKAEIAFKSEFPAVYNHLLKHKKELENRNKAETGIRYEWYALQRWGANYWDDFSKQKIVWGNLNLQAAYAIAPEGFFVNAPCPMIVPSNKYLLAVLNSKLADYYIRNLGVTRNGGYFEYKPMFVELLPVPIIPEEEQNTFIELVDKLSCPESTLSNDINCKIDEMIFNLYQLSPDEIDFVLTL